MGRPPAYIFIVRHGSRLDAADKLWHLSSPTPYDPPLTYGGWTQARALGQRIGDVLRENTLIPAQEAGDATAEASAPKKRRYKVVIHSSPFLRCVQTSVAIAAGIASDGQPLESRSVTVEQVPGSSTAVSAGTMPTNSAAVPPSKAASTEDAQGSNYYRSVLRLDAFLGEWLSPDYFELITPPPSAVMMVAGAKAALLRREDSVFGHSHHAHPHAHTHAHARTHTNSASHLWGASRSNTWSQTDELKAGPGLFGSGGGGRRRAEHDGCPSSSGSVGAAGVAAGVRGGYMAPVPHFALSSKAATPAGCVAHARDRCTSIDYQWDSMRAPYDWGDGGEFGEEWTAMHRRFRKGLQKLVDWYATSETPQAMVTPTVQFRGSSAGGVGTAETTTVASEDAECAIDEDEDEDGNGDDADGIEEAVVVLVSHGAGCNALIGAITQEPVLLDVGLASLSVAVRRQGREKAPAVPERAMAASVSPDTGHGAHSSHPGALVPLHVFYEMRLFASTDHLRSSSPTTPTAAGGRVGSSASVLGTRTRHALSLSSEQGGRSWHLEGPGDGGGSVYGSGSGNGNGRTAPPVQAGGITVGSGVTAFSPALPRLSTQTSVGRRRTASFGLWSPVTGMDADGGEAGDGAEDDDFEIRLSFGPESRAGQDAPDATSHVTSALARLGRQRGGPSSSLASPSGSNNGLWSSGGRGAEVATAKRRWSVNERGG